MVVPVDGIQSAVALAWDSESDTIFWTDVEANTISRAALNGSNQRIIVNSNLGTSNNYRIFKRSSFYDMTNRKSSMGIE
jgi:hypothetical protein